jgi:hypothetical protein
MRMRALTYLRFIGARLDEDDEHKWLEEIVMERAERRRQNLMMARLARTRIMDILEWPDVKQFNFDAGHVLFKRTPEGKLVDELSTVFEKFWTEEV